MYISDSFSYIFMYVAVIIRCLGCIRRSLLHFLHFSSFLFSSLHSSYLLMCLSFSFLHFGSSSFFFSSFFFDLSCTFHFFTSFFGHFFSSFWFFCFFPCSFCSFLLCVSNILFALRFFLICNLLCYLIRNTYCLFSSSLSSNTTFVLFKVKIFKLKIFQFIGYLQGQHSALKHSRLLLFFLCGASLSWGVLFC